MHPGWITFFLGCIIFQGLADDLSRCPVSTPASYQHYLRTFGNHCYFFVTFQHRDWNTARTDCHRLGGRLATVQDSATDNFIVSTLKILNFQAQAWLGLNDIAKEGHYQWDSGEPVRYTHWTPGQPPIVLVAAFEDCVALYVPHGYRWDDARCSDQFSYICELDLAPATATTEVPRPTSPTTAPRAHTTPPTHAVTAALNHTTPPTHAVTAAVNHTTPKANAATTKVAQTLVTHTMTSSLGISTTGAAKTTSSTPSSTTVTTTGSKTTTQPTIKTDHTTARTTATTVKLQTSATLTTTLKATDATTTKAAVLTTPSTTSAAAPSSTAASATTAVTTATKTTQPGSVATSGQTTAYPEFCGDFTCVLDCGIMGYTLDVDGCPVCACKGE